MHKKEEDYIKNLKSSRKIVSKFLVVSKEKRKSSKNITYLNLTLQDKTGQINAKIFNKKAYKEYDKIEENKVHNVVGSVDEYPKNSGKYNIVIEEIRISKNYEEKDFIRTIKNLDDNIKYLENTIKSIDNNELRTLLKNIFSDEKIFQKFIESPAAKGYHHNYKGGLLAHTNEVIEICKTIAKIYDSIDKDLLLTGAILHDIGKIETYNIDENKITFSYEGSMLEHLFIGSKIISEKMDDTKISEKTKINVIHLILSHHGKVENGWGSSIDPKLPEAIALHHADDMSAKITNITDKNSF